MAFNIYLLSICLSICSVLMPLRMLQEDLLLVPRRRSNTYVLRSFEATLTCVSRLDVDRKSSFFFFFPVFFSTNWHKQASTRGQGEIPIRLLCPACKYTAGASSTHSVRTLTSRRVENRRPTPTIHGGPKETSPNSPSPHRCNSPSPHR